MLRRSNMVKSKLLRFSAEDKTTGMWTNPKLMAPLQIERGIYDLLVVMLWFAIETCHTERRIVNGDKELPAFFTGVPHRLSRLLASVHTAFRSDAYGVIVGTNIHAARPLVRTYLNRVLRGDSPIALEESLGQSIPFYQVRGPLISFDADRLSGPETLFPDGGGPLEVIETSSHLPSEFSVALRVPDKLFSDHQ
jgi:hypothetical protein